MSYHLQNQDLHMAVIPEVTVEFATINEDEDEEELEDGQLSRSVSTSLAKQILAWAAIHEEGEEADENNDQEPSPMEDDDFAYPTNLAGETSEANEIVTGLSTDQDYDQIPSRSSSSPSQIAPSKYSSIPDSEPSEPSELDELQAEQGRLGRGEDSERDREGHSRFNNASYGADLIQVSVEDLLISEEQNRTIRANSKKDQYQHQQQQQKRPRGYEEPPQEAENGQTSKENCKEQPLVRPSPSTASSTASSVTMTTITATIRATGDKTRSILFEDAMTSEIHNRDKTLNSDRDQEGRKQQQQQNFNGSNTAHRVSRPPAPPKILTPAQQREAEADANIQKAIELHENNQLEEATHYFGLAAQSENPLGQLMYGLSLRHGWGCKPNPTEAIKFLQRAAEYAMGEMNDLNPDPLATASATSTITTATTKNPPSPPSSKSASSPEKLLQYSPPSPLSPDNVADEKHPDDDQYSHSFEDLSVQDLADQDNPQVVTRPVGSQHQTLRRMGSMDRTEAMATARKELVMALYELGMSYLKGWGVAKDKPVAFTYFKIAADLGDADSQNETALCYYEGIGIDKDMFQSAKYYRMASAQGASQLGNSWIWKSKYDQYCAAENAGTAISLNTTRKSSSHDRSKRLASAIHTAIHGSVSKGFSKELGSSSHHSSSASSPPSSPSIPSPQFSISSIASGLASVTAATAGAIVPPTYGQTIRQSLASPAPSIVSVMTPPSSTRGRSLSVTSASASLSSPTSPTTPNSFVTSTCTPTIVSTSAAAAIPTTPTEFAEKKRTRWSIWGGLRSTSSVSATTTTATTATTAATP